MKKIILCVFVFLLSANPIVSSPESEEEAPLIVVDPKPSFQRGVNNTVFGMYEMWQFKRGKCFLTSCGCVPLLFLLYGIGALVTSVDSEKIVHDICQLSSNCSADLSEYCS